jgi:hypothetical protein
MKHFCRFITGLVTVVVVCFSGISAFADSLNDEELTRRIDFIQDRLDEGKLNATRWQYSWLYINGAIAFAQLGMSIDQTDSDEKNERYDNIVGGIAGLLATGDLILNPLNSWNASAKLQNLPQTTGEEKKVKLQFGEQLLKDCADREIYGRSWQTHALAGLVSVIGGAAIALDKEDDDYRYGDGAFFFASSMLVAEIQIFTMPTRAIKDWEDYSSMLFDDSRAQVKESPEMDYFISATPKGLFCTILF